MSGAAARRTLVAAFGNALRGDDGFGIAVMQRLEALQASDELGAGVTLLEVGTGGLQLAQELLGGYDRVIVVDAMKRGRSPGEVSVLRVDEIERVTSIDLHLAAPAQALAAAQALDVLPNDVFIVGCEADEVDELTLEMTPPIAAAVPVTVSRVRELLG